MADPIFVVCPVDVWTKVATNVVVAALHKFTDDKTLYLQTYRDTGNPVPPVGDPSEGVQIFDPEIKSKSVSVSATVPIDVYVFAKGTQAGLVRVDE